MCRGVTGRLGVAMWLLERRSGVGVAGGDLGAAVTQRTLIVALWRTAQGCRYLTGTLLLKDVKYRDRTTGNPKKLKSQLHFCYQTQDI